MSGPISDAPAAGPAPGLASVDRSLRLLEELARAGDLGVTELAHRIGSAKATAHRLAKTLEARGYVVQNPDSTYRLGGRCLFLARGVHASEELRDVARPALRALRDATGETAQLTVLDGLEAVYVEQVASSKPVRSVREIGSRAPAHCVSGGLAILAAGPPELLERLLAAPLAAPTAASPADAASLEAELAATRSRGWSLNRGGMHPEVGGVGAPVHDAHGQVVAAVGACVPLFRLDATDVELLAGHVRAAAAAVTRALGGG